MRNSEQPDDCNFIIDPHNPLVSVPHFRSILPEFADSSIYTNEMLQPWLWVASKQLNQHRWGAMYSIGVSWFVAHQMALDRQAVLASRRGGVPGTSTGVVSAKAVNGVSVSYDTALGGLEGAGDWNLTTYGIRFLNWARMVGSGGVQITGNDGWPGEAVLVPSEILFPLV